MYNWGIAPKEFQVKFSRVDVERPDIRVIDTEIRERYFKGPKPVGIPSLVHTAASCHTLKLKLGKRE
jgi:hypothetical protein